MVGDVADAIFEISFAVVPEKVSACKLRQCFG
jgi:hypothetical protein